MSTIVVSKSLPWWLPLVQGALSILLGALFLMRPIATSATAVLLLGGYWFVIGILDVISLLWDRSAWGWRILTGIVSIIAGAFILNAFAGGTVYSALGATTAVGVALATIIGVLGILYGIMTLLAAFRGAGIATGFLGVLTLVMGVLILLNPTSSAFQLPFVIGLWLIVGGIALVVAAFRLRSLLY